MDLKHHLVKAHTKKNNELRHLFPSNGLVILSNDIKKSLMAMTVLTEYIRYCLFNQCIHKNKELLDAYCQRLLNYETSNQPVLIKACQKFCKQLIKDAKKSQNNLQKVSFVFSMRHSKYEFIHALLDEALIEILGTHVRAKN